MRTSEPKLIRQHHWQLVVRNMGREISDDDWQTWEPAYISTLQAAQEIFKTIPISYRETRYVINFDFGDAIAYLENYLSVMKRIFLENDANAAKDFRSDEIIVSIQSTANGRLLETRDRNACGS